VNRPASDAAAEAVETGDRPTDDIRHHHRHQDAEDEATA
jgi:hypothetical protein